MNTGDQVEAIREQFQAHRQVCNACSAPSGSLCPVGMGFVEQMKRAERGNTHPGISADAQFIAGKIVKHLWIIFVLLPVMLAILFMLLEPLLKPQK